MLTKQDLIDDLAGGCKPPDQFRIGTEHECFVFINGNQRAPYTGPQGILALLTAMQQFGWQPVVENGFLISMAHPLTAATLSLEPGGQFELSGTPVKTLHESHTELITHQQQLALVAQQLNIRFETIGFDPYNARADVPWMPKARYDIMRSYMPTRGHLGLDMMTRTCTVQVNLDYESESDMVKKMRVAMALQPMMTALFANSSWVEGKKTAFQSYRSFIWQNTDPDRCGILPFVFDDTMGFERYVDYMLSIPLYFVKRQGRYINAAGQYFRDFMQGKLPALPGDYPTLLDWHNHLTTAFPEVRLKHYLEMRGADSGPLDHLIGLPAVWVGLLYDSISLQTVADLTADWSYAEVQTLYQHVPKQGKRALFRGMPVYQWLGHILALSQQGLERRNYLNAQCQSETIYLEPLFQNLTLEFGLT